MRGRRNVAIPSHGIWRGIFGRPHRPSKTHKAESSCDRRLGRHHITVRSRRKLHLLRLLRLRTGSTATTRHSLRRRFSEVPGRTGNRHGRLRRSTALKRFPRRVEFDRRLLQLEQDLPMLRLEQTAKPPLLVAPALARPLLALLGLVRALGNGSDTLTPAGRAVAARARVGGPAGAFDGPEDLLSTHGDSARGGAVAADAGHARYLAHLVRATIDDLDGLEGFVLVHCVGDGDGGDAVCSRGLCSEAAPCVACSSSAIAIPTRIRQGRVQDIRT